MIHTSSEVNGKRFFYTLSQGPEDGPTLVLVHGAGGSHLHWPPELRRMPAATVYALDLPGHGRSEGPSYDTVRDYAASVVAFIRAVGIGKTVIVGHSMGGAIAQLLALDFPEYINGVVLVGSGARLCVATSILEGIRDNFEEAVGLITRLAWSSGTDPALIELGQRALLETGPDVLRGDFVACDRFDVMHRLGEIEVPTLIMGGKADQLTPVKYAHFLAEHIPNSRCAIIEGGGHMVMLEYPRDVAKEINGFLENAL